MKLMAKSRWSVDSERSIISISIVVESGGRATPYEARRNGMDEKEEEVANGVVAI